MGDSDEEEVPGDDESPMDTSTAANYKELTPERMRILQELEEAKARITKMYAEIDSGFASMSSCTPSSFFSNSPRPQSSPAHSSTRSQHQSLSPHHPLHNSSPSTPDYKSLYLTHIKLRLRFLNNSYHLRTLQTSGSSSNGHSSTIYCLQLYTHPKSGSQTLFTGSRDRTVREWDLRTGCVIRVLADIHTSSVLSLCVKDGYVATAGSDRRVAVWDLECDKLVKILVDHEDSVLCVRFDDKRLVSCSKGERT
jgi:F-box and WD-40 domain protein 1/11